MTDSVRIRPVKPDDIDAISAMIYGLSEKYITGEFSDEGARTLLDSMLPDAIKRNFAADFSYHVAEIDNQLVGVVAVRDNSHLYNLFVCERQQHRGIARKPWQVARDNCIANGNPGVFTVNSSNHALPVYQRLGFVARSGCEEKNGMVYVPMTLEMTE